MNAPFTRGAAPPPAPVPFALLSLALAGVIEREARALAQMRALEAAPRPQGRPQGLEWAVLDGTETLTRLRALSALLAAITPHEAIVRAIGASAGGD